MIPYLLALSFLLISAGVAAWKYKMFAVQEQPLQPIYEPPQAPVSVPVPEVKEIPMPTKTEQLYALSKSLLGTHLGRDKSIPWMVNCANACSDLLIRFGVPGLPAKGIAGTAPMLAFLEASDSFEEVTEYAPGLIIIAATGTGNGKIRGHVGCTGHNQIMSNNSESGKWDTQWTIARWHDYYTIYGDIPTRYFKPV